MWGPGIVGFGKQHYKYESGREGDIMAVGFAPRKAALVLYGVIYYEHNREQLEKLGAVTAGKGCLYIKDLDKIDKHTLEKMISDAFVQNNNAV
jgi:hypothetical protein